MKIDTAQVLSHLKKQKYPYILLILFTLLNFRVIIDLVADWIRDDNYSHGFFIIPISVYLFYKKRNDFSLPATKSGSGIALLFLGLLVFIIGTAASEFFATRVGFVLVLTGITLTYLGNENFKKVWFSFFFLLFMIPIPSIIYYAATIPMQLFATKVTYVMLKVIGVPIMRNGNILMLPDYALEVVEACSGLRSLVTLMALGALYAYFRMPGRVLPLILFFATIPIAIMTNIFRIFTTAVGAYAVSPELAESFLHEISGMLVFVTALILMTIFGAILVWIRKRFISVAQQ